MAEPVLKHLVVGKVAMMIYDFAEVGDTLPMHSHDASSVHTTIIARGSFELIQPGVAPETLRGGDVMFFDVDQAHELIALEPGSRMINQVTA
jgi:quercetin dioxygenase-like cupin family protein